MPRAEGVDKVTGRARYVDDLVFPGMIHGATVRSTVLWLRSSWPRFAASSRREGEDGEGCEQPPA